MCEGYTPTNSNDMSCGIGVVRCGFELFSVAPPFKVARSPPYRNLCQVAFIIVNLVLSDCKGDLISNWLAPGPHKGYLKK